MVRGRKYTDILELTVFMEFVRKRPVLGGASAEEAEGQVVMWKMEVWREKWAEDGGSVEETTKVKTNHGIGETLLIIMK
jgi:hypothetical protein